MNYVHEEDFFLQIVPRTLSPNIKWLGREADPASSAQVQVKCLLRCIPTFSYTASLCQQGKLRITLNASTRFR